jgi:hypothetical protein
VSRIDWLAEGSEILTRAPLTKLSYQQQEEAMAKRLSEQLADLSVQAKNAEDAVIAAEKEAHDKVVARKEQARVAASAAVQKVSEEIKSANDTAAQNWSAVKAKVAADLNGLKANIAQAMHDLGAERAENYAEELEWEAGVAIDYAIASVQQARYAVLDAVASRAEAEQAKRA